MFERDFHGPAHWGNRYANKMFKLGRERSLRLDSLNHLRRRTFARIGCARSRTTVDGRVSTIPGRGSSDIHRQGRHFLHQSANHCTVRRSTSHAKGESCSHVRTACEAGEGGGGKGGRTYWHEVRNNFEPLWSISGTTTAGAASVPILTRIMNHVSTQF